MTNHPLFAKDGAHVLVDGQFGSTGKGVLAAWLALQAHTSNIKFSGVISNAGPNSGHTFFDQHGEKHVLKQLPTFAVASYLLGRTIPVYLSAGAVIDLDILEAEWGRYPGIPVCVHPNAAVLTDKDRETEHSGSIAAVAGTRSGTGAAIARKVMRDPKAVFGSSGIRPNFSADTLRYFVEVSQGFSLGLNQQFYPKCTSRECTVAQAIADAGIAPRYVTKTYMSCRTYPIRVGNVDGFSSGGWYPDQEEITWDSIGQTPELTTVTQRVRRIATFSEQQFTDACDANAPDHVFMNFMNYLSPSEQTEFLVKMDAIRDGQRHWFDLILGYGSTSGDVHRV